MKGNKDNKSNKRIFSVREGRAVLFLLPLLGLMAWVIYLAAQPKFDDSAMMLGDTLAEATERVKEDASGHSLFRFDPNEVTYEDLRKLGVPKNTAAGIIKYREAGKVFAIPEDFATCYGVTDSMYSELRPYIFIGEEYGIRRRDGSAGAESAREAVSLSRFDPNVLSAEEFTKLGFSVRQAEVIVRFRNSRGGFASADEFAECYVVSDEMFDKLREYIVIGAESASGDEPENILNRIVFPVDINSADSMTLLAVPGIGPKTAAAVIEYRKRLGGFYSIDQMRDLKVVNDGNWELMREQIWADSCAIQKIDINFASPNSVEGHPYISQRALRRLLSNRQLRGGWSTIEDMIEDNTFTMDEAAKIAPYLHFSLRPTEN